MYFLAAAPHCLLDVHTSSDPNQTKIKLLLTDIRGSELLITHRLSSQYRTFEPFPSRCEKAADLLLILPRVLPAAEFGNI